MTERHAVLMLAFDNVPEQHTLTVQTLESVLAQDIGPLDLLLIDNGSSQIATWEHFQMVRDLYLERDDATRIHIAKHRENISPVKVINRALQYLWNLGHDKVLGVANDVILPENCYRLMDEWPRGLVTGSETREKDFPRVEHAEAVNECTPAAVALIRKWFHDALVARDGYYLDENFFLYASDCDFALRMAACGIRGVQTNLNYWHYGSAHWRLLPEDEGRKQTDRANVDRAYFLKKWGFTVDSLEYGQRPADLQWGRKQLQGKAVGA
jgi:GT2 family glycosyltransferase